MIYSNQKQNYYLKEVIDQLEKGVQDLFSSEKYKEYLKTMSRFYEYSARNVLLIHMQCPNASYVAGYNDWKNKFHRHVKFGEHGIKILAPCSYRQHMEIEKRGPITQQRVIDKDGNSVMEVQEVIRTVFKPVTVFDVSQTEGKPMPMLDVNKIIGDVDYSSDFFQALKQVSPFPIDFEEIVSDRKGYCNEKERRIAIKEGMSQIQNVKTAIREITHAVLHNYYSEKEEEIPPEQRKDRHIEVESIAYTICQHYGIDNSDYSFDYAADWGNHKQAKELKASFKTIQNIVKALIISIDEKYQEIIRAKKQEKSVSALENYLFLEPQSGKEKKELLDTTEMGTGKNDNINHKILELDPSIQPIVTILWSENSKLQEDQKMTFAEADAIFYQLDTTHGPGYDKTKFRIDFRFQGELDSYEGRQDFGDGDGGLIDHIKAFHEYYAKEEHWKNHVLHNDGMEALEQDAAYREMILTEFVPYLRLHCSLSEMEQAANDVLAAIAKIEEPDGIDRTNTAYYTALQSYVNECRRQLNSGTYELPEAPKKEDFIDPKLLAYQEQIREEIRQEAADAGMTVEEYAANDYKTCSIVEICSACHSNYVGMVAMMGADNKVYMGKAENYDDKGCYDNRDSSLCFISENTGIYPYLYSKGWLKSQEEMLNNGLTIEEYQEFAALQQGVLGRFEQQWEILFDGKPFNPLFSFQLVQEQTDIPIEETTESTASKQTVKPIYYAIDEQAARHANNVVHFSDYQEGSATSEYQNYVNEAAKIAERQKKRVDPMYHEKIDRLLDAYCHKLATNMNHHNKIMSRVPSVMIVGPSNFPVRKKEKQNAAMVRNMQEWQDIQGLLDKIQSIGMGGISADDPKAISKLQDKLAKLEELQESMKAINAYYRKEKTLDNCPYLSLQEIENLKSDMAQRCHQEDKPYLSFQLSNNSSEIRRVKSRIESLRNKEQIAYVGWEFDGGQVKINQQKNRLQVFFNEKPSIDVSTALNRGGFRWAPSEKVWQRQLTDNVIRAANFIKAIQPITGERPAELQQKAHIEKSSVLVQMKAAKDTLSSKQEEKNVRKKEKEIER